MKKFFCFMLLTFLFSSLLINDCTTYSENELTKLRIGYVESETFDNYSRQLSGIFAGFQKLGIVESNYKVDLSEVDTKKIWNSICNNYTSDKIEFVEDMYFNMKNMNESDYIKMVNRDDIDLIITMGTVAGKYFLAN